MEFTICESICDRLRMKESPKMSPEILQWQSRVEQVSLKIFDKISNDDQIILCSLKIDTRILKKIDRRLEI
jgi:hypothetical protein